MDIVIQEISQLAPEGGKIVDLMCGTAAVSRRLRNQGYSVIANDLLTFCYYHAVVNLCFTEIPKFKGASDFYKSTAINIQEPTLNEMSYHKVIAALNSISPTNAYFWREFSLEGSPSNGSNPRNYFSPTNAAKIDGIRAAIKQLRHNGHITQKEHVLLLHDLVMATNDVANIAGTYGHYLSRSMGRSNDVIILRPTDLNLRNDNGKHSVHCGYAEEIAGQLTCDVCYIDPPYMKRQYAANYHVLETIAREDEPHAAGQSGLRPWRDQYSNFCTRTRIQESFGQIFDSMKCENFLISYSEDGLLSIDELLDLFNKYGTVEVKEFKHKRFRSNNSNLDPMITEYIFHIHKECISSNIEPTFLEQV